MSKSRSSRPSRHALTDRHAYWTSAKRPLQILAFLLPLILAYELALPWLIAARGQDVKAHRGLVHFFEAVGAANEALYLGGIVIVLVLLLWHLLNRDAWRINWPACGIMGLESLTLTTPLLIMSRVVGHADLSATMPWPMILARQAREFDSWSAWEKATLSIGAGLYEELMFRMLLIAVLHTLLVDVGKASNGLGAAIAVCVSAAAFSWYHAPGSPSAAIFYFLAGVYFGGVYVIRGFGIVVGTHALYDIITFSLTSSAASSSP